MSFEDVKVGDELMVSESWRPGARRTKVTHVGRRWLTLAHCRARFERSTGRSESLNGATIERPAAYEVRQARARIVAELDAVGVRVDLRTFAARDLPRVRESLDWLIQQERAQSDHEPFRSGS